LVAAFQNIGVRVVFFFDGPTEEKKMRVWLDKRKNRIKKIVWLFTNLNNINDYKSQYFQIPLHPCHV
jgi:hypothetical protein